MIYTREFSVMWVYLKFMAGYSTTEQDGAYFKWCEDNLELSPIKCPILNDMPWMKLKYKTNPFLAMVKK